jgi:hypothetical protein
VADGLVYVEETVHVHVHERELARVE